MHFVIIKIKKIIFGVFLHCSEDLHMFLLIQRHQLNEFSHGSHLCANTIHQMYLNLLSSVVTRFGIMTTLFKLIYIFEHKITLDLSVTVHSLNYDNFFYNKENKLTICTIILV